MNVIAERGSARTSDDPFGLGLSLAVFDRATRLANSLFASAGASIILAHEGKIWRSRYADILPKADPVTEAILAGGALVWIEDGTKHAQFKNHPLVVGPPHLRFTVGVPIRLEDGSTPGVLSVSGLEPLPYDAAKARQLHDIADFIADEWVRAHAVKALADLLQHYYKALQDNERAEGALKDALAALQHRRA